MRWIRNLKMKYKVILLILLGVLSSGIVGITGITSLQTSIGSMNSLYQDRLIPVRDLNVLRVHYLTMESDILQLIVRQDKTMADTLVKDIEQRDDEVNKLFKQLEPYLPADRYKTLTDEVYQFNTQRGKIVTAALNGSTETAIKLYTTFSEMLAKINDSLDEVAGNISAAAEQANEDNHALAQSNVITTVLVLVLSIAVIVPVGWLIVAVIARPLQKAARIARTVAEGDLRVETLNIRSKDEVGQLAGAIDHMVQNLQGLISEMRRSGKLVAAAADELFAASEQTSRASEQSAAAVAEIHDGTQNQLQSIQELTRAMEEMNQGTQQITKGSEEATNAAVSANNKAMAGKEVIVRSVDVIENLAAHVVSSSERMNVLGNKMKDIDKVMVLIASIAKQTNLLALNASIEAARAGEHGRSFSVVAQQIRQLAEESNRAAAQVTELIQMIGNETNQLVMQGTQSSNAAKEGLEAVREAGVTFTDISTQIEDVTKQMVSVSAVVEQMSAYAEEVLATAQSLVQIAENSADSSRQVAGSTQEALASMEEIKRSSDSLTQLSGNLDQLIDQFKS